MVYRQIFMEDCFFWCFTLPSPFHPSLFFILEVSWNQNSSLSLFLLSASTSVQSLIPRYPFFSKTDLVNSGIFSFTCEPTPIHQHCNLHVGCIKASRLWSSVALNSQADTCCLTKEFVWFVCERVHCKLLQGCGISSHCRWELSGFLPI